MPDLTPDEVNAQLASKDLRPLDDEDLVEITHRINALQEAIQALDLTGLDEQEALTVFGAEEPRP